MGKQPRAPLANYPRTFAGWSKELRGVVNFLNQAPKFRPDYGDKWTRKMILHYVSRYRLLIANPPHIPAGETYPTLTEAFIAQLLR